MILDTKGLLNYFDRSSPGYWAAAGTIESLAEVEELVVSPFVIAELEAVVLEVRDRVEAGETLARASVAVLAGGAS